MRPCIVSPELVERSERRRRPARLPATGGHRRSLSARSRAATERASRAGAHLAGEICGDLWASQPDGIPPSGWAGTRLATAFKGLDGPRDAPGAGMELLGVGSQLGSRPGRCPNTQASTQLSARPLRRRTTSRSRGMGARRGAWDALRARRVRSGGCARPPIRLCGRQSGCRSWPVLPSSPPPPPAPATARTPTWSAHPALHPLPHRPRCRQGLLSRPGGARPDCPVPTIPSDYRWTSLPGDARHLPAAASH